MPQPFCRLGRCFCLAEVSTGHPHLRNDKATAYCTHLAAFVATKRFVILSAKRERIRTSLKRERIAAHLTHSCGAQKLFSLGARTTFDRGARRCSLLPAPQALTTSLRMTHNLVIANTCGVRLYFRLPVIASDKPFYIFLKILTCLFCFLQFSITYFVPCDSPSQNANTSSA